MQHVPVPVNGNPTQIKTCKLYAKVGPGDTPCKRACEGYDQDKGQGWAEVNWPEQFPSRQANRKFPGLSLPVEVCECVSYPGKYPYCPLEVSLSARITSLQRLASESLPLNVLPSWQAGGCDWAAKAG